MAASSGVSWAVTSQREDFQVGPTGQPSHGMVVVIQTGAGVSGSVFIPDADYTPEKVRPVLAQLAARLAAVHSLGEGDLSKG